MRVIPPKRAQLAAALAILLSVTACSDQHAEATGPDLDGSTRLSLARSGDSPVCVILSVANGNMSRRAAMLVGDEIPMSIPSFAQARRDRKSGRRLLRVTAAQFHSETGERIGVSCLTPTGFSDRQLADRAHLAATLLQEAVLRTDRPQESSRLVAELPSSIDGTPPALLAGQALLIYLGAKSPSVGPRAPTADGGLTAASYDPWRLETVHVHAWGGTGTLITNSSAIYWTLHDASRWSAQGLVVNEDYPSGFCVSASERWIALNDELEALREDSVALAAAMTGTSAPMGAVCESQGNSKKMCVDFFIMSSSTFVLGVGDSRTFDANAKYGASRAQIYLDLDAGLVSYKLSSSTAFTPAIGWPQAWPLVPPFVTADPYPHFPKDIRLDSLPDGRRKLTVELYNGFCTYAGRALCPAINAEVIFTKLPSGEWSTGGETIVRDKYPSLGIYREGANGWQTVYEDPEGSWWQLIGKKNMLEELEREREETLGGCILQ